ncbi:hypothetical protein FJY71_04365, partial [candidate division WOR-3 bacterium]|nr:hypothetical protein [candidate division WOR-3 bacterium]
MERCLGVGPAQDGRILPRRGRRPPALPFQRLSEGDAELRLLSSDREAGRRRRRPVRLARPGGVRAGRLGPRRRTPPPPLPAPAARPAARAGRGRRARRPQVPAGRAVNDASTPRSPSPEVRLETFEGPVELLLYLVRQSELDVCDVPIGRLTDDYLGYIRQARRLDLEVASDFLVMAGVLVRLKARRLVPSQPDEDTETPTVTLDQILDDFRKYQRVAELLGTREAERRRMFPRR